MLCTDHVPGEVGQPVEDRFDAADKLKVFGFTDSLLDQKEDKAGRHKGHGEDHTDGDQNIYWCGHPGRGGRKHIRYVVDTYFSTYTMVSFLMVKLFHSV